MTNTDYVTGLEDLVAELEETTTTLRTELRDTRRSLAAYKANATRRREERAEINVVRQLASEIADENQSLRRTIAAYKANATRRARRVQ